MKILVLDIPCIQFEEDMGNVKYNKDVLEDSKLDVEDLKVIVRKFKTFYTKNDLVFPTNVYNQLRLSISAVFRLWMRRPGRQIP